VAHEVFVSYSSKDKTIADAVVASMESNGIRCWYAPRDIRSGDDWGNAITKAVDSSKIFLLIFSGHANQSQRVLDELNLAISCEIPILPFRIENLEPDGAMRLHLTSRHWLDAFDPSWEKNLQKLIHTVSASLDVALSAEDIKLPGAGRRTKADQKNKWIKRILIGIFAAAILIFAGWYGLGKLPLSEAGGIPSVSKTADFIIPDNGLWQSEGGSYTAVGSLDTIAWSEGEYAGDIEISLDIESPNSFAAANIIVYGNGISLSSGNLIFTVANDLLAINKDSIYGEDNYLFDSASGLNFVEGKHTVLIKITDRKATLSVDGELISSVFLNEDINTSGRIGLLKYWEIDEITFSNIRIKGSEQTQ